MAGEDELSQVKRKIAKLEEQIERLEEEEGGLGTASSKPTWSSVSRTRAVWKVGAILGLGCLGHQSPRVLCGS